MVSLKLEAILAYERTGAWRADGAVSIETWVAHALGVRMRTAADYVRVARAFRRLPLTHLAFREGRLSFDQVKPLVEVATAGNEGGLIDECACRSAEQIQRMTGAMRPVSADDTGRANADRWVRWSWSNDDLSLDLAARFPAAEGAMVVAALERVAHRAGRDAAPLRPTHEQRCADALVELTCAVPVEADTGRALVVVHVDAEVLREGEDGTAAIEGGPPLGAGTVRRLACDAQTLVIAEGANGTPLGIRRRSRYPRRCSGCSGSGTRGAGSRGADGPAGSTPTTSVTGPTGVGPTRTTSSCSAERTTVSFTRGGCGSRACPTVSCSSSTGTAGRSSRGRAGYGPESGNGWTASGPHSQTGSRLPGWMPRRMGTGPSRRTELPNPCPGHTWITATGPSSGGTSRPAPSDPMRSSRRAQERRAV